MCDIMYNLNPNAMWKGGGWEAQNTKWATGSMDNDVIEGWMTMQLKDDEGENFFSLLKKYKAMMWIKIYGFNSWNIISYHLFNFHYAMIVVIIKARMWLL